LPTFNPTVVFMMGDQKMPFQLDTESTIDLTLRKAMLRLRKHVFCDTLGWDIPHCGGQEADIYDFNRCFYLNWTDPENGTLLGSVRLIPFADDNLMTTVFRRSHEGDRSSELRQSNRVWEGTRLCLNEAVLAPEDRVTAMTSLLLGLFKACEQAGIETLMCNCNSVTYRLYRTLGLHFEHIGVTNEFHHGPVHCLAFGISDNNFEVLTDLANRMNLDWPEVDGKGIRFARATTQAPVQRLPDYLQTIPAPLFLPSSQPVALRIQA
jgi:N-acyl-L-homoserine lactone synthetase